MPFSVLPWSLHTDLVRALPVQWANSVPFLTVFFWAVSLELRTSKKLLPKTYASTPQQRQSGIYRMSVHRQNSMLKERTSPAVMYLNTCAYCPYVFLCTYISCICIYSSPPFHPTPALKGWCLYLVKESILPQSEHHHVRPVSSPKGSKKVLNGKRWREKSVQKWPNKGKKKKKACLVHFPVHRTKQAT